MPTIQAQDIVNAVIQDSMVQTTNRTALYDYTDRVHQRILRESQWRFLLSDPQTFVTMPGVSSYTLIEGTPPAGSFSTGLNLTNFGNLDPSSVYSLTTWTKLYEDPDDNTTLNYYNFRDGSLRYGYPRTYSNSISNPGTILLKPCPDDQNLYYPVPETPVATFVTSSGSLLPPRLYYGVVTFVDSLGGESTQCVIPFTVVVPAGSVLTVDSPNPVPGGGISGNQTSYSYWNVYVGPSINNYSKQNAIPIPIGTSWTEPSTGVTAAITAPTQFPLYPGSVGAFLSINSAGNLITTQGDTPIVVPPFESFTLSEGGLWFVTLNSSGILETVQAGPGLSNPVGFYPYMLLKAVDGPTIWQVSLNSIGQLQATNVSGITFIPPATSTIQPINAYVIQFRYYASRNQIVNPTDVLQIPYAYKDIVISGVNYLACMYMDRNDSREPSAKTMTYKRDFDAGLAQIRRDLRINFRKTDFIAPDVVSQYVVGNQQGIPTMGW
jgi:hypothetical protein